MTTAEETPKPRQLAKLARPFPAHAVKTRTVGGGRKASYVGHADVTAKLLLVLGPYDWDATDLIRENGHSGRVVGCNGRLTVTIDGRRVTIAEPGSVDETISTADDGTKVDVTGHDGDRAKLAASDALKRCAMRAGVALNLWSGAGTALYDAIVAQATAEAAPEVGDDGMPQDGEADEDHADPDTVVVPQGGGTIVVDPDCLVEETGPELASAEDIADVKAAVAKLPMPQREEWAKSELATAYRAAYKAGTISVAMAAAVLAAILDLAGVPVPSGITELVEDGEPF